MAPHDPITPRQSEVLDRTLDLVRELGLAGLTIRRVAQRMGFSEAALYRHFPSKEALLAALVDRLEGQLLGPIRQLAGDQERPPGDRLAACVRHHVRTILATDGLPILLLAEAAASGDEALTGRIRQVLGAYLEIVEGLLAALPHRPEAPSIPELAHLILGLPAATAIRHRLLPDPELERRAAGELVDFLIRCLTGRDPQEPERRTS